MYHSTDIKGVNPIVAMPFTNQGEVDYDSFHNLLEHLTTTGINGLTLFGIASEFPKLNDKEKERLAQHYISDLRGSGLYHTISVTEHSTELAVQRAKYYEKLGADALMLLPPFFLQPVKEEVTRHINAVLEAVTIPVLIQYAPGETGMPITPEQLAEVVRHYPHAVLKIECNPPVDYTRELLSLAPQAIVMNGYAGLYMMQMLAVGGKGVMPGCSFSELYVEIYQSWLAGDKTVAQERHARLLPFISQWMTHVEYIIQIEKTILQRRGIIQHDYCRHPGWNLNQKDYVAINRVIEIIAFR